MSALPQLPEARLEPMRVTHLDALLPIEQQAYTHPWTRGNFIDSMHAGYHCMCLVGPTTPEAPGFGADGAAPRPQADTLIGYFVAMKGVDEVHLLNITVAPAFQHQGWAALMLTALSVWSRAQGAGWLWLEVRVSNTRAQQVYERHGFRRVGQRKGYYPAAPGRREDAIVMSLRLEGAIS
ncbi:ribosomal protein S18-alanine N-acetyltransferase [uncultured Pseudacidovorax sp.]|uniref:ribosomal protein S18-alanine N-acetyltransferase n=1 Tax=uncultured Pseudacidovorax sp. TaxID=679313 RepID=UPI0025D7A7A9|nr:ribosomal protein S18-alanine N-acetyltransferase [uncultured Pseudacidovorax sp.]